MADAESAKDAKRSTKLDRVLTVLLIASIVLAVGMTVYVIVTPKQGEKFTEFYILGPNGTADEYPTNLAVAEEGMVIIGVVNHEYANSTYQLEVLLNGTVIEKEDVNLMHNETWEDQFTFHAIEKGDDQKLEFLLFNDGADSADRISGANLTNDTYGAYRSLHLWVDVRGRRAEEKFTEFYILGPNRTFGEYPTNLSVAEEGMVIIVVSNHEHVNSTYRLEVLLNGTVIGEDDVNLMHNEVWKDTFAFNPIEKGEDQKLEFLLYKDGADEVYRSIRLWVDVRERKEGEKFTGFYILGPNGTADEYPTNLSVGEVGMVIIGVVNHEYVNSTYQLEVLLNGTVIDEENIDLMHNEVWRDTFAFNVTEKGDDQKLEFLLYKDGVDEAYQSIHLWVDVRERRAEEKFTELYPISPNGTRREEEKFTEFYILGPNRTADEYPTSLAVGEEGTVIIGVINHEYANSTYRLEVLLNERALCEENIDLMHNETWEDLFTFSATEKRKDQKLEFLLYKDGVDEAYRSLRLWVDARK